MNIFGRQNCIKIDRYPNRASKFQKSDENPQSYTIPYNTHPIRKYVILHYCLANINSDMRKKFSEQAELKFFYSYETKQNFL